MTPVDLGLSVKWASCNLGATKPEESGDLFAWGETMTKSEFSWETLKLKWYEKYTSNDHLSQLQLSDDAANQILGEKWRMPTKKEYEELIAQTIFKWTKRNGVDGALLTSKKNGKSIFFPEVSAKGYLAGYWSSSVKIDNGSSQYAWYFSNGSEFWPPEVNGRDRYYGYVIRPVYDPKAVTSVEAGSANESAWLVGTWTVSTSEFGRVSLIISGNGQTGRLIFDGEKGSYEVKGDELRCHMDGDPRDLVTVFKIHSGHRIYFGGGYYFNKVK